MYMDLENRVPIGVPIGPYSFSETPSTSLIWHLNIPRFFSYGLRDSGNPFNLIKYSCYQGCTNRKGAKRVC